MSQAPKNPPVERLAPPEAPIFGAPLSPRPSQEALDLLARRRSASAFNLTAPGPDAEQLAQLLRLAARAPDHGKLFPWRFIVLQGEAKARFAHDLEALVEAQAMPEKARGALGKLKAPPVAVAVVSRPVAGQIPEWEQLLSAGSVCTLMLLAAEAMGFGANWITDWYSYDPEAMRLLGVTESERVAGFIYLGAPTEPALERVRPDVSAITTQWRPAD